MGKTCYCFVFFIPTCLRLVGIKPDKHLNYLHCGRNMISNDMIIMIAEDDDAHYILTERYLRRSGINNEIIRFNDGEQLQKFLGTSILRYYLQRKIRNLILILDINMPKRTGIEVLSYMKQNNILDQIPTIMFSTCSDPETKSECLTLGSSNFVTKPPTPKLIESIIGIAMNFAHAV
ncbi:MAG TPA: response regulator [Phycisphaerales bacterium]|nr:response regulator [Phycisphaerales bacterium]